MSDRTSDRPLDTASPAAPDDPAEAVAAPTGGQEPTPSADARAGLHWWRELALVGGFYLVYSAIRNLFGSATGSNTLHALHNAERVIDIERTLHIFNERTVQEWVLGTRWLVRLCNIYYGSLHFVVPVTALVLLFVRWPSAYRLWRNTLAFTTAFALFGFSLLPLMPPRLLCDCPYGAGHGIDYGFVDTLDRYGGLWSFDSGTMHAISNQYAAMPSLHIAWALWCALVLVPRLRNRALQVLAALYPVLTLFAVVVTGNHFWLDAVGGVLTLGAGYAVARLVARLGARTTTADDDPSPHPIAAP